MSKLRPGPDLGPGLRRGPVIHQNRDQDNINGTKKKHPGSAPDPVPVSVTDLVPEPVPDPTPVPVPVPVPDPVSDLVLVAVPRHFSPASVRCRV